MKCLIFSGAGVQCVDDCGRTPLHFAAMNGQLAAVEYLVSVKLFLPNQSFDGLI